MGVSYSTKSGVVHTSTDSVISCSSPGTDRRHPKSGRRRLTSQFGKIPSDGGAGVSVSGLLYRSFEFHQGRVEVCQDPLQVRDAAAAAGDAEVEVVTVARQRDVH